jgi:hypothetical protein
MFREARESLRNQVFLGFFRLPKPNQTFPNEYDTVTINHGGASDLVIGAVFKTVGRMREHASVGFDSHTPPPSVQVPS